jgi:hypothetical protein
MALILLSSEHRQVFRDRRRANTMQHQNSVFHGVLKHVPWQEFERILAQHGADKDGRGLTSKAHLIAMVYAQLSGAASLREIEIALTSHAGRLYHLGGSEVARSTLAEANRYRPAEIFADLFAALTKQAQGRLRRQVGRAVRLIDATSIPLTSLSGDWAQFSAEICGAKAHLVYDPDSDRPLYAQITASNVNDITAARAMPIEPGTDYVFDLGYYDFAWWASIDAAESRFVTRLKVNSPFTIEEERPVPAASPILSDRIGRLSKRLAASRKNPISKPLREVRVRIDTGAVLRLVTNDLDAPAQEIADLYKRRWAIELFFRWIKQTLKIRHFFGTTENAVRIQIATALITFLLLRLAQQANKIVDSPLAFTRIIRANLMHRREMSQLLRGNATLPPPDPRQITFGFDIEPGPKRRVFTPSSRPKMIAA